MTRTRTCEHAHIVVSGHVLRRPKTTKSRLYFRDEKLREKQTVPWLAGGRCDSTGAVGFAQHCKLYVASGEQRWRVLAQCLHLVGQKLESVGSLEVLPCLQT